MKHSLSAKDKALLARSAVVVSVGVVLGGLLYGCNPPKTTGQPAAPAASAAAKVEFVDVTKEAGIAFAHSSGARGKKFMPETVGSGVAFLDYDGDAQLDLFYINSTDWNVTPGRKPHYPALYHNEGGGKFTDVTKQAGLHLDVYGMGAAVGDYNNDGRDDIYLTCIGPNHLFKNEGNGTFTDVTKQAHVAGTPIEPGGIEWKWSSSAAWCDYDKDGIPDLFVCNYVKWTPKTDVFCTSRSGMKAYCAPMNYEGNPSTLYHGKGDGTFEDVTEQMGLSTHVGKGLGVIVADLNGDDWPDIFVTNDTSPNFLYINEAGKHFREVGLESGIAVSETGQSKAGMGIDIADYENNGRPGLLIGNFSRECLSLFENDGKGAFRDQAYPKGVAQPSLTYLTFGLFFFDMDMDGRQDFFTGNGHIDDFVNESDATITYRERPLLYRNEGSRFSEIGAAAGPAFKTQLVTRGCAWGDYDLDGYPDIAVVSNNMGGYLWKNRTPRNNKWIGLKLRGSRSTRDAWGTKIRVETSDKVQTFELYGGGSFLSQSQRWKLVGLGSDGAAARVLIQWPSGEKSELTGLQGGHYYEVVEGEKGAATMEPRIARHIPQATPHSSTIETVRR